MLTDYTDVPSIRAVLGVSEDDLDEVTVMLPIYEDTLTQDLEEISLDLIDTYLTTSELATPTATESRFLVACRVFATYSVAKHLTSALPLFAAKQVTDGKAQVSRFDNPYKESIKSVVAQYDKARAKLVAAFTAIGSVSTSSVAKTYFSVVTPSTDPITGS
jgi:hypothetical protein